MPNLNKDLINDTLSVDLDSTQTLSNKTLTTPIINGPTITATGQTPVIHGIYLPEPHVIYFEGSTADGFETILTVVDPTADRTVSLPDASGTVALSGTIALGTDTTGNYVATIAGTADQITVSGSGSESAAVTISLPANVTISNNLVVTGDLTVSGNTTTLNTANLNVEDSFILLNSGVTGSPTLNSGLEVERGTSTNVFIRWDETTDKWQFTNDGSTYTNIGSAGLISSATAPVSPSAGDLWFDTSTGASFIYYNSAWIELGGGTLSPYQATSTTRPSSPWTGQHVYETDTSLEYVYGGSAWQQVSGGTAVGNSGLVYVKSQTVGTGVSSVTVSNAFSTTYDNYQIQLSGGVGSGDANLRLTLGATATGYYAGGIYVGYTASTVTGTNTNNGAFIDIGYGSTNALSGRGEIESPFLTKRTVFRTNPISTSTSYPMGVFGGYLNDATSYTAFTITASSGTMTGGTITVYGYRKA